MLCFSISCELLCFEPHRASENLCTLKKKNLFLVVDASVIVRRFRQTPG